MANNATEDYERLDFLNKCYNKIRIKYKDNSLGYSIRNNAGLKYLISQECDYL